MMADKQKRVSSMRIPITDTYDAAMTAIIRQALAGEIDSNLAVKRINRARLWRVRAIRKQCPPAAISR